VVSSTSTKFNRPTSIRLRRLFVKACTSTCQFAGGTDTVSNLNRCHCVRPDSEGALDSRVSRVPYDGRNLAISMVLTQLLTRQTKRTRSRMASASHTTATINVSVRHPGTQMAREPPKSRSSISWTERPMHYDGSEHHSVVYRNPRT
jgi:hypothetical protein